MTVLNICDTSGSMMLFFIIKTFISIICTILPVLFIYRVFVPFFKTAIGTSTIQEQMGSLIRSFVAAIIVFMIPSLLNFFFTNIVNADMNSISFCYTNSSIQKVNSLREEEKKKKEEEKNQEKKQSDSLLDEYNKAQEERNKTIRKYNDEYGKILDDKKSNAGDSGGTIGNILKSSSNNIIIGDSRTVGMCVTMTGQGGTACSYNSSGPLYSGNDIYIAQGAMSYTWFNSSAVPAVNAIIAKNPDVTYNIISLMGVNALLSDIDKYIPTYNSLATGSWSNHNLILVSVNPVDEVIEAQHGYSTKNANIVSFNNQLRSGVTGKNVKYCDTYNLIYGNMGTGDGLHYSGETYRNIYNGIMSCFH